jgi:hypothetical protein
MYVCCWPPHPALILNPIESFKITSANATFVGLIELIGLIGVIRVISGFRGKLFLDGALLNAI